MMKRTRRTVVVMLLLAVSLVGQALPASAHGTCKATAWTPTPAAVRVAYGAQYDCTESHNNLYVEACLQKSTNPLFTSYSTVQCATGHAGGNGNHVHVAQTLGDICLVGYYRVRAHGWNGNLNHSDWDYGPTMPCGTVAQ